MNTEEIIQRIQAVYPDAEVAVDGADCSLSIQVISDGFSTMARLQRQRSIMKIFADELQQGLLHALTIRAQTPAEAAAS